MNHELRIIVVVLFMILASIFLIHPAYAQDSTTLTPIKSGLTPIPSTVSPTSPLYTDLLVNNLFHSFSCLAIGQSVIGQPCLTYQVTKNAQGAVQSVPMLSSVNLTGGTLGAVTGVIGALYQNPPVRTADYLASVGQSFGIVKEAHAQVTGSGAGVLNPILSLWQVSRNISYVIMILIFVIIGVMIIFRTKINPQTVISAQAALPGLVIGLILITFSYFFAALVTDTAFIGTNLIGSYFSAALGNNSNNLTDTLKNENVLSIMSNLIGKVDVRDLNTAVDNVITQLGSGPGTIVRAAAAFLAYQYSYQLAEVPSTVLTGIGCLAVAGTAAFNPVSQVAGTAPATEINIPNCIHNATLVFKTATAALVAGTALASPASVISMALYVILIAVLLYTMLKLLLSLVNCFLTIIFYTITAPFIFLFASLPGRQGLATGWILDMLANVLAFPAVISEVYFVSYILGSSPPFPAGGPLNLTGNGTLPLFGNLNINFTRLVLAFGALIATPSIPGIISKAIGRVSQAGQMIGQEIGGGMRSGQGYVGQARQGVGSIQTEGLYDQPGYIYRNNRWERITGATQGFSPIEKTQAGVKPGFVSRTRGLFR